MDVKAGFGLFPHAAAAHISFVANNQRSRNGVHRAAGGFVMVGNGRNNGNAVRNAQIILLQNLVGQQAAVFRVVGAVDGVADIVHVPGNFSKLNIMGAVVKLFQDVRSGFRHVDAVRLRMVGKAQKSQILVALFQQLVYFGIVFDVMVGHRDPHFPVGS